MNQVRVVGIVSSAVLAALGDEGQGYVAGEEIFLGDTNIEHMKTDHLEDYLKYQYRLPQILAEPDYVGINDVDGSLEYVKVFSEHVKLAVRVAGNDKLYVRSMYVVKKSRTDYFIKSGRLKPLTTGNK